MSLSIASSLADIQAAKTSELLAFYNAHRNPIQKFRDRASAERRIADLIQELKAAAPTASAAPTTAPASIQAVVTNAAPANAKTYLDIIRDHSGSMSSRLQSATSTV